MSPRKNVNVTKVNYERRWTIKTMFIFVTTMLMHVFLPLQVLAGQLNYQTASVLRYVGSTITVTTSSRFSRIVNVVIELHSCMVLYLNAGTVTNGPYFP
ncbi:hypothetical protein GCK32_004207 [Trichostrongylus colubriformis]|uniref:Uncharacterized protein n=1 Tax=Trichostrongylus colubriformis TaxID=6319 RepID=A0AAN8ID80_TRICO